MKNRTFLLLGLIVLLLGIWWFLGSSSPDTQRTPSTKLSTSQHSVSQTPSGSGLSPNSSISVVGPASVNPQVASDRISTFQAVWNAENGKNLDFYGEIVDQNGQPVADVDVAGNVLRAGGIDSTKSEPHKTKSDANGLFRFEGLRGMDLGIVPSKVGYEYDLRLPSNWSDAYKADPNNPVIFTMWKIQGAEPMIHTELDSRVPYDGTYATFDFFSGMKSDVGALIINLIRNPIRIIRSQGHFDWTVQISVSGGGLVEATDSYKNLAPENGYQPTFSFSMPKDDPNWTQSLTTTFYVHTAKGQYGRVDIDLTTDSVRTDGTGISIEAWINPSGSRNLEFDPKKQIKTPAP